MMKLSKKIKIGIIISLFFSFLFLKDSLSGGAKEYDSQYVYVINRENGNGIIKKNEEKKTYPASLTKIMTVLIALEHIKDLSAIAPVDIDTYREMVQQNASMAGFYGKEQTTYRDLLYGTILTSGGEAANSLAIHISGNTADFVKLMNQKVEELDLKDTHFTNPEGLHDRKQYTTASDMAHLLEYALKDDNFRAIFTKEAFRTSSTLNHPEGIVLESTVLSKLEGVSQNDFEIIGGKSGMTSEAGQCWITLAIKEEKEYIAVVMGSKFEDISNPSNKQIEDTLKIYAKIE